MASFLSRNSLQTFRGLKEMQSHVQPLLERHGALLDRDRDAIGRHANIALERRRGSLRDRAVGANAFVRQRDLEPFNDGPHPSESLHRVFNRALLRVTRHRPRQRDDAIGHIHGEVRRVD